MKEINGLLTLEERWKQMKKKKRQNLDKMKRVKRMYVKAKLEKKRINQEVKLLQAEWQERIKNNPTEAKSAFANELKNVSTEDMFPKDLEKEFDTIELKNIKNGRTMKTEDLSDDLDLRHKGLPINAADVLERELKEDLDEHDNSIPINEATEPDDDIKIQLEAETIVVGLTDNDLFIDEDGNEEEVTNTDEEK